MRVSAVLLRWYKSFNVNYMGYQDRRPGVSSRPWNLLSREDGNEEELRFIEIPLEADITTVVGANESGKSHLLSAISKVLTGTGIPDGFGNGRAFSRTDLCHYKFPRNKNAEDWPNIGLQFNGLTRDDIRDLSGALEIKEPTRLPEDVVLTVVLAQEIRSPVVAHAYLGELNWNLNEGQLNKLRTCLPSVEFIKSDLAISDHVALPTLIAAYSGSAPSQSAWYDFAAVLEFIDFMGTLNLSSATTMLNQESTAKLVDHKSKLDQSRLNTPRAELEVQLFRDVLGITKETLEFVVGLEIADRTHADGLIAKWNQEIDEKLNLSHYWQQDDSFALKVNYKQGMLYFEITDKTGATYTFRERSSGLRYFLSYYVQAKALELRSRTKNAIVLMDEPDSFLSILGQRNLLAVFESLVRAESSGQKCQLVYTSHSPFLINRNFPHRLRLVKKGDAEEGTQLIAQAMLRRYEPIRSALGIDCSQTLFMGATNLVVEGPSDQYLLGELIRRYATPANVNELLDLNSVVVVSAESAPSVEKILIASQWGDEPIPATVVLLDSDNAGAEIRKRITGKVRNCKELIKDEFVLQIGELLPSGIGNAVITIEDLIPVAIYREAVVAFLKKWHPDIAQEKWDSFQSDILKPEYGVAGFVAATRKAFIDHVFGHDQEYDKYGVLQEVVTIVAARPDSDPEISALRKRLTSMCEIIRRRVAASQQAARRQSGKQSIKRHIDEFFIVNKESSAVFNVIILLDRIQKDVQSLGPDGELLDAAIKRMLDELAKRRDAGQSQLVKDEWIAWKRVIDAIRKNPLEINIRIKEGRPGVESGDIASPISEPIPTPLMPEATQSSPTETTPTVSTA